jgi:glycosyltransferase involved in cell wall biosynthesis
VIVLAWICLICAAVPALLFVANFRLYLPAPRRITEAARPKISVLIPARDEEARIGQAISAVLENTGVEFELLILDDHSTDRTAEIVRAAAAADDRVRLIEAPELPSGWCGKVHACHVLAGYAGFPLLVFVDADVRLANDALLRFAAFMEEAKCDLASGVPRQLTGTWLERLLIPLIHFVLLGFLPLDRMRRSTDPALGSAIGQLIIVRSDAYEKAGGHAAIWNRIHDGLGLARAFRVAGFRTDLFDATDTATCRMYERAADVWTGLAKNATEAMATPRLIVPCSALLSSGRWRRGFCSRGVFQSDQRKLSSSLLRPLRSPLAFASLRR